MKNFTLATLILFFALAGCSSETPPAVSEPAPAEAAPPATAPPDDVAAVATHPELNLDERGRALRGYDPVAYFQDGKAVAGDPEIRETWQGGEYFFTTEENRQAFVARPETYLPSHGGYCTFGIVLEKKFDGDPEVWLIRNDQLHIFLNREVQEKFLNDEEGNLARVEANWPRIRDKTPSELESGDTES